MSAGLGNMLKVEVVFKDFVGGDVVNSYHLEVVGVGAGGNSGMLSDIQEYVENLYSDVKADINAGINGYLIEVNNLTTTEVYGAVAFDPSWTGSNASGSSLPSPVAMLVLGRTVVDRVQARKYLPAYTSVNLSSGHWDSGTLGRAQDFGDKWMTVFMGTNTWEFLARACSDSLATITAILSTEARLIPAYQTRRKEGRGS